MTDGSVREGDEITISANKQKNGVDFVGPHIQEGASSVPSDPEEIEEAFFVEDPDKKSL